MTAMNSDTLSRSESIHFRRDVVTVFTKKVRLLLHRLYMRFAELTSSVTAIPMRATWSFESIGLRWYSIACRLPT